MIKWRNIVNAPTDGTNILARDLDMGLIVATSQDGQWLLAGTSHRVYVDKWMPLPAEPPRSMTGTLPRTPDNGTASEPNDGEIQ